MLIKIPEKIIPQINRIIKFFIICDLFMWAGWGFIDPLFSIFVLKNIGGATIISIGILAAIYWVTKSILQIPISIFLDQYDGEKDDFYALIFGLMIISLSSFSFMITQTINQVYFVQFIKAIGFSMYIPAWSSIFSRHLDRDHTAFEWAISSSSVGLGIGAAGFIGSSIANFAGFNFVFLLTGLMALIGAGVLIFVPELILPKKTAVKPQILDHIQAGLK